MEELDLKNKTIMVVGAHPDDNDFTAAGTVAKASSLGCKIIYVVATKGNRGSSDPNMTPEKLWHTREKEQRDAGKILGVNNFEFLEYNDGELVCNLELKEKIVMLIRKYRPDMVFTMDPSFFYFTDRNFVNHTDHRAIGEATMDAVYPLSRDLLSFPEHIKQGLQPFTVKELCFTSSNHNNTNAFVDISDMMDTKIKSLISHVSQISDNVSMEKRVREWANKLGKTVGCNYAEGFVKIKFET